MSERLKGYYDYDFKTRQSLENEIKNVRTYVEGLEEELEMWEGRLRELEHERRWFK